MREDNVGMCRDDLLKSLHDRNATAILLLRGSRAIASLAQFTECLSKRSLQVRVKVKAVTMIHQKESELKASQMSLW